MFIFEFIGAAHLNGPLPEGRVPRRGRPPHGGRRGRVGHFGPMATTPQGGWPAAHGHHREEINLRKKSLLIPEIPRSPPRHPTTSPPLSLPATPTKGCVREEYLPSCMPSCCRNFARRSTSATSAGLEGPGVVVIHRTCEYSEVPLYHQSSRQDHYGLEVGFSSSTSYMFLSDVKRFRSTRGMLPKPSRYRITNR